MNDFTFYTGTKVLRAKPMNRGRYNAYRGWSIPEDEDPNDEGYIVVYPGDGKTRSYISWSPKATFEKAYRTNGNMTFGHAIQWAKQGKKIARKGWNGKGMWVIYVPGSQPKISPHTAYGKHLSEYAAPDGIVEQIKILPHFDMFTANQDMQPGWVASQSDMDADDWGIV